MTTPIKPKGPIGTVPGGSREHLSISHETLANPELGTEGVEEPNSTPVSTFKDDAGLKNMEVKVKQADPLTDPTQPLTEEGPGEGTVDAGMEGSPDLGAPNEQFEGMPTGQDMGGGLEDQTQQVEPYGLQVLRRLLDDLGGLLHDHDGFMQHLEDESTRGFVQKFLELIAELMDEIEELQAGHPRYSEFGSLGGEGEEGMEEAPPAPGLEQTEGQDVEAASQQDQETTPEEALMGMAPNAAQGIPGPMKSLSREQYFAQVKALKAKHKSLQGQVKQVEHIEEQQQEKEAKDDYVNDFDHAHKKLVKQLAQLRKDLMGLGTSGGGTPEMPGMPTIPEDQGMQAKRLALIKKIEATEVKIKAYKYPKSAVKIPKNQIPGSEANQIRNGKIKSQPSDDISADKAEQILEDGEVRGHKLTKKQRGMFGAAAHKKGKTMSRKDLLQERKYLRQRWATIQAQEQKALNEQAREKSLLVSMWKSATTNEQRNYIQARHKSLEAVTPVKGLETEKNYIKKRWKELGKLLSKGYDESTKGWKEAGTDAVKKFAKRFTGGHKNIVVESRKFLSQLSKTLDYSDEQKHQAYYLYKSLTNLIGDVCGKGSVKAGLRNLAKALITEETPKVQHPNGPSKYNDNEKMQQWEESESVIKGKKDFPQMAEEYNEVEVTHPSSNPQAKPHNEWMPYHEGEHLPIEGGVGPSDAEGEKSFPAMSEEDNEIDLTHPDGPSKYNPHGEPLQQWKPGESIVSGKEKALANWRGTLVQGLKNLATASNFFKMLAHEKAFGDEHREEAAQMAIVLVPMEALAPHLAGLQDHEGLGGLESPIDFMEEEAGEMGPEGELEHPELAEEMELEVEPEEEEGNEVPLDNLEEEIEEEEEEPGDIGEKALPNAKNKALVNKNKPVPEAPDLSSLMNDNLRQSQAINNMQQSLQALISRFSTN